MEIIPFLIFAFVAFKVFSGFTKTSQTKVKSSPKDLMQRLNAQIENDSRNTGPTQRGRESLARKNTHSPWGENGAGAPGARVAANYIQKTARAARKESHVNPEQTGRRGRNVDQNRNRTDEWGQRGDSGFLNGRNVIILLAIGAVVLFVLSQIPAN